MLLPPIWADVVWVEERSLLTLGMPLISTSTMHHGDSVIPLLDKQGLLRILGKLLERLVVFVLYCCSL